MCIRFSATAFLRVSRGDVAAVLLGWFDPQPCRVVVGEEATIYERELAETRDTVGPERYAALTATGAAMSYDEIAEYALRETDQAMSETEPAGQ